VFLLVGLGNPGEEFALTRHNVGFRVLDALVDGLGLRWHKQRKFAWTKGERKGQELYFLKPLTFMNRSGEGLRLFFAHCPLREWEMVVVHDDLDFPPGRVRVKRNGGTGGHRGLESIAEAWGGLDFGRVRVGIGRPKEREEVVEYVLGIPQGEEATQLREGEERAREALLWIVEKGWQVTMNVFNTS